LFRAQLAAHLLQGLGFDLADALGRHAVFRGQLVERGGVAFGQPAALDDVTAAVVEFGDRAAQPFVLKPRQLGRGEGLGGLGVRVGQVGDGCEAVLVVAAVGLERDVLPAEAGFHLHHVLGLDVQLARDRFHFIGAQGVAAGLQSAQVEEQLALGLGGGHLDQAPVLEDVFVDLGLDPVDREGHQTHAPVGVEALDRLHEADIAFLDQVGMGQTVAQVATGDRNHQPQVGHDQLARRFEVFLVAEAMGEFDFFLLRQHRQAIDRLDVLVNAARRGRDRQSQGRVHRCVSSSRPMLALVR